MMAKSKLNSIKTLTSQELIDMEISHEEFIKILKEKDKYEKIKDNLRSENKKYVSNDTSCKQRLKYEIKQYACKNTLVAKQCITLKT